MVSCGFERKSAVFCENLRVGNLYAGVEKVTRSGFKGSSEKEKDF